MEKKRGLFDNKQQEENKEKKQKSHNQQEEQIRFDPETFQLFTLADPPEGYHSIIGHYYQSNPLNDDSCDFLAGVDKLDANRKKELSETIFVAKRLWKPIFKDDVISKIQVWCKKGDFPILYNIYQHLLKQYAQKPSNALYTLDNPYFPSKKDEDTFVVTFQLSKLYPTTSEYKTFHQQLINNNCLCPIELTYKITGTEKITFNATGETLCIHFFITQLKTI